MFSQLASGLALLPMLFHSVLGCCWHHEHGSACGLGGILVVWQFSSETPKEVHAEHSSTCASHRHHKSAATIPAEHSPARCPHSPCDQERCEFANTSTSAGSQVVVLEHQWCDSIAELQVPRAAQHVISRAPGDGRLYSSAGERRALVQVWLI